jgi:hypothetical protein
MKRTGTFLLLLLGLTGVGCLSLGDGDKQKAVTRSQSPPPEQRPVMVEDVNEKNPREALRRLDAELKSEEQKK